MEATSEASGPATCQCGAELAGGIAVLTPLAYPEEREQYENVALGAGAVAPCPQCQRPNHRQEVAATLMFHPARKFFVLMPASASDEVAEETERQILALDLPGWTVDIDRDPAQFRGKALGAVLGLIDPAGFAELKPAGRRDLAYHAALLTATRPGLLRLAPEQDASEKEIAEHLAGSRLIQIGTSFAEAFADADVATLEPIEAVEDLFPAECFDARSMAHLHAVIEARAAEGVDVAAQRAALAAAARHGEVSNPGGLELARDLVRKGLAGTTFQQEPQVWSSLLNEEDLYRAIGSEARPSDPAELERVLDLAQALGHGEAIAQMAVERTRVQGVEEDADLEAMIESIVEVASKQGAADETLGASLSQLAGIGDIETAVRAAALVVDRLVDERPVAVVGIVVKTAAQLKNEGRGEEALALLDATEDRLPKEKLPAAARSRLVNERGNALREMYRYEEALRAYRSAIAIRTDGIESADLRVALLNEARTLRDLGLLQRSLDAFAEVLPHTKGRERFDCLFGMTISHQRAGNFRAAQPLVEEAFAIARSIPVDDQIARFMAVANFNARALGLPEPVKPMELNEAVENSELATSRQKLLTLGETIVQGLRMTPDGELRESALEIAHGLNPPALAADDPQMAVTWLEVAHLAGDEALARETVEALLAREHLTLFTMRAACIGAEMTCAAGDWEDAAGFAERAVDAAVSIADLGSRGTASFGVAETLGEVRALGAALAGAPGERRYEALIGEVADAQCSLILSLRLGQGDPATTPAPDAPLQVLQWLDAGDRQVPVLTRLAPHGRESRRGSPLPTELASGVGERVAGRVTRSPALASDDLVAGVAPYRAFRDAFLGSFSSLDADPVQPLTAVPSAALAGIPLHHALPDLDIAYSPSLAVAATLSRRASTDRPIPATIAEISCACFNDGEAIVEALASGSAALADLCDAREREYRRVADLEAQAKSVADLLTEADVVKLSCHGVANATAGRFALLLSDGTQLPPPLPDLADRDDELARRFLFDWRDLIAEETRCRLVVSSACASGSGATTGSGEQIGLARAYLASGALAFLAPLWPVAAAPAQEFANAFIDRCLSEPDQPLATSLRLTRTSLPHLPERVRDAFVLHGHSGAVFSTPSEEIP